MSYEMNFEIYVEAKEQRKAVLEVIKKTLLENGYEKDIDNFVADKKDKCKIMENTSCSLHPVSFNEAIQSIYTAIVKELPEVMFEGYSGYFWGSTEAAHAFKRNGNILEVSLLQYEGCGSCPECGEEVVFIDDYNPEETYYCPECGEEVPNEELYSYYESEDIIYEIIDGELIRK